MPHKSTDLEKVLFFSFFFFFGSWLFGQEVNTKRA